MLERMDMQEKTISLEKTTSALATAGIPEYMREGLLLAGEHYGEIDTEPYRLNIMNALDIAEDKVPSFTPNNPPKSQTSLEVEEQDSSLEEAESSSGEVDLNQVLLDLIARLDKGEGVDFDTLLSNAAARGHDRDASEATLDDLTEDGSVHEPRFGGLRLRINLQFQQVQVPFALACNR